MASFAHTISLGLALFASSCGAAPLIAPQWTVAEITLTAQNVYANPFLDVAVNATFTLQGGGAPPIVRAAFWDGGSTWRVRFAGVALGNWSWATAASAPADAGLSGASGVVTVVPYEGGNALYQRGFLRVARSGRFLEHADGTPFRWLGDTSWYGPDLVRQDACNAPPGVGCSSAADAIAADRAAKGFTVAQTYFCGQSAGWWVDGKNYTAINASAFSERVDPYLARYLARGILPALGLGLHEMSVAMPRDALVRLGAYAAARYGAHHLVWITAQEVDAPNSNASVWGAVARALFYGSYGPLGFQPLTAHMWIGPNASAPLAPDFLWGGEPWHQWFATQGGHGGMGRLRPKAHFQAYWNFRSPLTGQPLPCLEAEAQYENITCGPWSYANATRAAAWKAQLLGAFGYTYGGAALWLFKWSANDTTGDAYNPGTWWYPNLALPGASQVALASQWLHATLGAARTQLAPRWTQPGGGDEAWGAFADDEATVLASVGSAQFVIYAYSAATLALGQLGMMDAARSYEAAWLNARDGSARPAAPAPFRPAANGTWALPEKPDAQDWVLYVSAV